MLRLCRLMQWTEISWRSGCIRIRAVTCANLHMTTSHSQDATMSHDYTYLKQRARQVFDAGVQAVLPNQMVKDALRVDQETLTVNQQQYTLDHNVHIVAFGKAVIGMVRASEDVLGDHVVDGIASVPCGIQKVLRNLNKVDLLPLPGSKVKLIEGAKDNLPDSASHQAATEIMALAERLTEKDIMLVLISGGGSALLPAPAPPITLEEKAQVIKALALRGASIEQLNTVRKNLSSLKGGKLAKLAWPAKDCLAVFNEFGICEGGFPSSIFQHIGNLDALQQKQSTPSSDTRPYANNVIIGSNSIAVRRSCELATTLGFEVVNISNAIDGEASTAAQTFVDVAHFVCEKYNAELTDNSGDSRVNKVKPWFNVSEDQMKDLEVVVQKAASRSKPVCVIGAGETTVTVRGGGRGGRNQELALAASIAMETSLKLQELRDAGFQVVLLSGGTDGQDGPTDAAGALADADQVTRARQLGLDPMEYLSNNDSYTFYKTLGDGDDLLVTGLTGTNVMDLQILLVHPPK